MSQAPTPPTNPATPTPAAPKPAEKVAAKTSSPAKKARVVVLVALLAVVAVAGYIGQQTDFTFDISRFFAAENGVLTVQCGTNSNTLTWTQDPRANSNGVERGNLGSKNLPVCGDYWCWLPNPTYPHGFSYTDTQLLQGICYEYRIKYRPELPSNSVFCPANCNLPSTPTPTPSVGTLTGVCLENGTISLNWTPDSRANSNSIEKGDSYPSDPSRFWEFIFQEEPIDFNPPFSTYSLIDSDVIRGIEYTYRVKYRPDLPSNEVRVTCPVIATPTPTPIVGTLAGQCVDGAIVLNWTPDSRANSNSIEKGDSYPNDPNRFWEFIFGEPAPFTTYTYTDRSITPGIQYTYRVKYRPELPSNEVQVACPTPTPTPTIMTPPPTPTPIPLTCSPTYQTAAIDQEISVSANGGNPSALYQWAAPGVGLQQASSNLLQLSYPTGGYKVVVVGRGSDQAACAILVATPTPTPTATVTTTTTPSPTITVCPVPTPPASGCVLTVSPVPPTCQYEYTCPTATPTATVTTTATATATVTTTTTATPTATIATAPALAVEKTVRNITQNSSEVESVTAKPNETVEFILRVHSTGNAPATQVTLRDAIPSGLSYQAGSTTIDGAPAADGIISSGLALGDLPSGRVVTVRFRATVANEAFFAQGTTILTNTAFTFGQNVAEASNVAFVAVQKAPASYNVTFTKEGRNVTDNQSGSTSPVYATPGETIEFVVRIQSQASVALNNVSVRDVLPQGISLIPGTVRVNGQVAADSIITTGVAAGQLAAGQEIVVLFSGRVADSTTLPAGTTTLINTATMTSTEIATISAQLPVVITNEVTPVTQVPTGPGDSAILALIVSAVVTLLYVGYTATDTFRRREASHLADRTRKDGSTFDFKGKE